MLTYTYISNNLQKSSKNKKNVIGEKNQKTHSFSSLQTISPSRPPIFSYRWRKSLCANSFDISSLI